MQIQRSISQTDSEDDWNSRSDDEDLFMDEDEEKCQFLALILASTTWVTTIPQKTLETAEKGRATGLSSPSTSR
jgi:hypothetical protein